MKYRNMVRNPDGTYNIVWFGSAGKDENNNKIPAENYVDKQDGISKSLIQRLAVIKNELWYNINYGFPLIDKVKNKAIFDAYVIRVINSHQEISKIKEFKSVVVNKVYTFDCIIVSIYGDEFTISNQLNV